MITALIEIGKGITINNIHTLTAYSMSRVFTDFVKQSGYDGLVTIEGGEGIKQEEATFTGEHDTYVVFDPTKAEILNKKKI